LFGFPEPIHVDPDLLNAPVIDAEDVDARDIDGAARWGMPQEGAGLRPGDAPAGLKSPSFKISWKYRRASVVVLAGSDASFMRRRLVL
jgi:hypothetical protein